jgi:uncharacterized integral membrane protein
MSELDREAPAGKTRGEQTKFLVAAGFGGLGLLFAALNFDEVDVNWIVGSFQTPLIIVIAVSFVLGAGVGALAARRGR